MCWRRLLFLMALALMLACGEPAAEQRMEEESSAEANTELVGIRGAARRPVATRRIRAPGRAGIAVRAAGSQGRTAPAAHDTPLSLRVLRTT